MSIKSFLQSIAHFISRIWKDMTPIAKKSVAIAVSVVDAIKKFETDNPNIINFITSTIPGDVDEKIVAAIRAELPKAVVELKLIDATLGLTDPNEIVVAATKVIQQMSGDYKSATLNSLAIILTRVAADGKIDWADAVYLGKWFYDHKDNEEVDTTI